MVNTLQTDFFSSFRLHFHFNNAVFISMYFLWADTKIFLIPLLFVCL